MTDREAIQDLLVRYTHALDDKDWELLRRCFLPDAHYQAMGAEFEGFEAILGLCRGTLGPLDASHHMISNFQIEVDGERATSRCYFQAQHVKNDAEGGPNFIVAGNYRDELTHSDEGWRIAARQLEVTWRDGNPAVVSRREGSQ